jgi:hypothetical protein
MATLRNNWLEAVSACTTVALLAIVYTVLHQYAAGPSFNLQQTAALHATTTGAAATLVAQPR